MEEGRRSEPGIREQDTHGQDTGEQDTHGQDTGEQDNHGPDTREQDTPAKIKWTARDSVFACLVRIPKYRREFYLSLFPEDTDVTEEDCKIVTIENVLSNGLHNDLSLLVRDRLLILAEAQTTFTRNITLRLFLYLAETWKRLVDENQWDLYGPCAVQLPSVDFVVIYTGERQSVPETLRLANLSVEPETTKIDMEARVVRWRGKNDLVDQYIRFCEITAETEKRYGRTQEAIERILAACMDEGILVPFLRNCEKEVRDIMTVLFDEKRIQELHDLALKREYLAEGRAEGEAIGEARGEVRGIEKGTKTIAREMLLENFPVHTIVRLTKLSEEAIGALARSMGVTPVS